MGQLKDSPVQVLPHLNPNNRENVIEYSRAVCNQCRRGTSHPHVYKHTVVSLELGTHAAVLWKN